MFGNVFYRQFKYKMVTHARVFSLKPKFKITDNQGIFLSILLKYFNKIFGYEKMCSWERIKNLFIKLPIKNGKIYFDFMEKFITELKIQRITDLKTYLSINKMKNVHLSSQEKDALFNLKNLKWQEFKLIDIFTIKNTKSILSRDIVENSGIIPYLCASSENNAISSYISYKNEYLDKGNCIFIGGKTFVVTYQKKDFFSNDSHNLSLHLKNINFYNEKIYLYLVTCIYKNLKHKYSWGNSISNKKIQKDTIYLPIKNNSIDYKYMEYLISAIQKLIIKDIVSLSDKKIYASKTIINKSSK